MTTTEPTDQIVTLPDGAALHVSDYGIGDSTRGGGSIRLRASA